MTTLGPKDPEPKPDDDAFASPSSSSSSSSSTSSSDDEFDHWWCMAVDYVVNSSHYYVVYYVACSFLDSTDHITYRKPGLCILFQFQSPRYVLHNTLCVVLIYWLLYGIYMSRVWIFCL